MKYYSTFVLVLFSITCIQAQNVVSGAIQTKVNISGTINENCGTNSIISNPLRFTLNQNNIPVLNFQPDNGYNIYEVPVGQGVFEVVPTVNFSDGFNVVPEQFEVSFVGNSGELVEQNICIEPRVETIDGLEIKFYPFYDNPDPFINRFDAYIYIKNTNTTNYTGQLRLVYDDNHTFILDTDETPDIDENGETIWNTINIGPNSTFTRFLRIAYNSDTHPNYPVLAGDQLTYDLFLTNSQSSGREANDDPDFRLIQTIDASEQTLSGNDMEDPVKDSQVKIYPNPSDDLIYINHTEHVESLTIYSINGQLINAVSNRENNRGTLEMDISELTSGIYFLTIKTTTAIITKKIVKD